MTSKLHGATPIALDIFGSEGGLLGHERRHYGDHFDQA